MGIADCGLRIVATSVPVFAAALFKLPAIKMDFSLPALKMPVLTQALEPWGES
jgi:hypothetical protein